jgi:hypothetical protein
MNFGEFENAYQKLAKGEFKVIEDLFFYFHPQTRSVLWRILVTQTYLYKAFQYTCDINAAYVKNDLNPFKNLLKHNVSYWIGDQMNTKTVMRRC